MEFSPEQAKALDAVSQWLRDPSAPQVFRLFGYAGTGKSTIAKHLIEQEEGQVLSATFTGKAASVLRKKGMPHTTTLHSLIYRVKQASQEAIKAKLEQIEKAPAQEVAQLKQDLREMNKPQFILNEEDSPLNEASLLLIDEVSMVDEELGSDVLSFGKKILVLGDPGQLPPVKGTGFFTSGTPDVLLTQIHRQAADNPIIFLATQVRNGFSLSNGSYGSSVVKNKRLLSPTELRDASQILVGRNATRRGRNTLVRSQLGRSDPLPVQGDRIICLKNDKKQGLLNGVMYETLERAKNRWVELRVRNLDEPGSKDLDIYCHEEAFLGKDLSEMPWYLRKLAQEFDYGYAITVHKAQGSQWPDVLIENEAYCFKEEAKRWLYTAITRAEERLTVVQ